MKYQNFNRSCAYAAIANLLLDFSIDTEDYKIVKSVNIAYIFTYDLNQGRYMAGPMHQGKKWFNYFLHPLGLEFKDQEIEVNNALNFFENAGHKFMVGLNMGVMGKHTVISEGKQGYSYRFLNIKWAESTEPDFFFFDSDELLAKLDDKFLVGWIKKRNEPIEAKNTQEADLSLECLQKYQKVVTEFCSQEQDLKALHDAKRNIFEVLFLDVLSMMEIIGELELADEIKRIRSDYVKAMNMKGNSLVLAHHINMFDFARVIEKYGEVIEGFRNKR